MKPRESQGGVDGSEGWRHEVEIRDPQTTAELMTGKPQADPCSQAEPMEELKRNNLHLTGWLWQKRRKRAGPSMKKELLIWEDNEGDLMLDDE